MARVVPLPRSGHGRPPVSVLLAGLAAIVLAVGVLAATGTLARIVDAISGGNAGAAAYDTATVIAARRTNVLLIPNTAISFAQTALSQRLVTRPTAVATPTARPTATSGGATEGTVITLDRTKLIARPVTLGVTGLSQTEVLSGLQAGETIVTGQVGATSSSTTSRNAPRGGGLFGFGG